MTGPTHIKGRGKHKGTEVEITGDHPRVCPPCKCWYILYLVIIFLVLVSGRWLCCCWQRASGKRCSSSGPTSWERRTRSTRRSNSCLETKAGTKPLDLHSWGALSSRALGDRTPRTVVGLLHHRLGGVYLAASLQSAFLSFRNVSEGQCDSACFWVSSPAS